MSRVTPPVIRLTHAVRRISSSSQASHSFTLLDSNSHYLPRSIRDLKAECIRRQLKSVGSKSELVDRLVAYDLTRAHSTTSGHRPSMSNSQPSVRTRPLMQGFWTSAPTQAAHDTSTIDFFFFPEIPPEGPKNPFAKLRVPLLPDNYTPDRSADSAHAAESLDEAVPGSEILIVASHPEDVAAVAMTEVVGNDGVEQDLDELTKSFKHDEEGVKEPGVLKELWSGLVDDLFGPKTPKVAT